MGSFGGFGSSSPGVGDSYERETQAKARPKNPKPDPGTKKRPEVPANAKFSKVIIDIPGRVFTLAIVHYDDVKKFNGAKLLVYSNATWASLDKTKIDPHFYEDSKGPVARFTPDEVGLSHAIEMTLGDSDANVKTTSTLLLSILKNLQK